MIANNSIRSLILEIGKTTDLKSLKYWYFVLFPEKIFKVNKILKSRSKHGSLKSGSHGDYENNG